MTGLLHVLAWVAFAAACVVTPRLLAAAGTVVGSRLAADPRGAQLRAKLAQAAPTAAWMAVALVLTWPLLFSSPMSRDHAIHYYFTRLWLDDVMAAGEVSGWSDRFNAGIPIGDSYGWLSYAWASALHMFTFGVVPLRTSYGWSILALWWGSAGVVAAWSRALARELFARTSDAARADRCAAWAGSIAAIAWLVDPGAARQGGWNYVMFHGVWPQQLSTMLALLALCWGMRAFERPRGVLVPAAALAVAASLVAHPFALVVLAVLAALVPAVRAFDAAPWPRGAGVAWTAIFVLGGAAASGFLATFFASAGSMGRSPVPWRSLGEVAAGLLRGDVFHNPAAFVGPLGVLGLGLALWRGRARARVTVVAVLAFAVLASEASVSVLGLDLFIPGLKNLQFPRFAFMMKPLLASLAGLAAVVVWIGVREVVGAATRSAGEVSGDAASDAAGDAAGGARRGATHDAALAGSAPPRAPGSWAGEGILGPRDLRIFVLALVVAPFVVTLLREPGHLAPRPVGHVPTVRASGLADAERELQETLALEREAQLAAGEGTLRVAYLRSTSRGGTYPLFALADVGAAVVLDGHVPSVNFQPTLGSHAPEVLRALGVTHVVFEGQPAALEAAVRRELEVVATHGPFTVARLFSGRAAALPAAARVIESSAGRRVVEVGAGGGAVLVPPYRRWRATDAGGAEVELERQRVWKRSFTVVKIGRDRARATPQRITLELVRTPLERVLGWVSLGVAVALVGWLVGWGWVQRRARAAEPRGAAVDETPGDAGGARRGVQAGAAVAVAGYVAATLLLGPARLLRTWEPAFERAAARQGVDALIPARDLVADGAYHTAWRGLRACDGLLDRDARAGCDPARERPTVRSTYRAPYLHRCVEVPVAPGGRAEIVFEGLRDDETVVIFARREDGGRRGLSYWMRAGASSDAGAGVELAREKLYGRLERVVSPSEHRGEITLRFENRGAETERPCVAAATGRPAMK